MLKQGIVLADLDEVRRRKVRGDESWKNYLCLLSGVSLPDSSEH